MLKRGSLLLIGLSSAATLPDQFTTAKAASVCVAACAPDPAPPDPLGIVGGSVAAYPPDPAPPDPLGILGGVLLKAERYR